MTTYACLLRAVNLASHNKVAMSDLRTFLTKIGMHDAKTLLQSGNAAFRSDVATAAEVEQRLESSAAGYLGLKIEFFIRTAKDLKGVIAANPFPKAAEQDPSHLLVLFLKDVPAPASVTALQNAIAGREVVNAVGRQAYMLYPDGIGRSRVTSTLIEKKLGTRGTGRNWNTVLKLTTLLDSL